MSSDIDRVKGAILSIVRAEMAPLPYFARYECRVVVQNADGTLELMPDDPKIPGLSGVRIYSGIPGVTVTVSPGARCLLEFAGGDPSRPIVTGWEPGDAVTLSFNGGDQKVARVDDTVDSDSDMARWIGDVNTVLKVTGNVIGKSDLSTPSDFGKVSSGADVLKA